MGPPIVSRRKRKTVAQKVRRMVARQIDQADARCPHTHRVVLARACSLCRGVVVDRVTSPTVPFDDDEPDAVGWP